MLLQFFVSARSDDFGVRTIGRAKFDGHGFRFRQNRAAMSRDFFRKPIPVIDLDTPVVNPRPGTCELRFMGVFAVIYHEREIELAIGHMAGDMLMIASCRDMFEPEYIFIEASRVFQISDLYRQ